MCTRMEKNTIFSITKKAEKFCSAAVFVPPNNLQGKPILRQAKIVSQRYKEFIQKQRLETFVNKSQHGVHFRQMKENDIDTKLSLSWLEKCHISPQTEATFAVPKSLPFLPDGTNDICSRIEMTTPAECVGRKLKQLPIFSLGATFLPKKNILNGTIA